jgi:hypothetical protein
MPVDEDMAYRFADKIWFPGSGFNSIAFVRKRLVPGSPRPYRLRVCPPAELPGSDTEYPAGAFLGESLNNGIIYDINHNSFDLKFEMAI